MTKYGPARRYTDADVYWSLHVIQSEGIINRSDLSKNVRVGEGSMRKILSHLKEWDLIEIKQAGITITEDGNDFLESIPMRPIDIEIPNYVTGNNCQGMIVSGGASAITNGHHQCDIGNIVGATGCTAFIMKGGRVIMSPDYDLDEKDPETAEKIKNASTPNEGDVILIGSGDDWSSAMRAAVSASLDML